MLPIEGGSGDASHGDAGGRPHQNKFFRVTDFVLAGKVGGTNTKADTTAAMQVGGAGEEDGDESATVRRINSTQHKHLLLHSLVCVSCT